MIDRGREQDRAGGKPLGFGATARAALAGPGGFDAMGRAADPEVWETLAGWRAEGRNFALLTVIESRAFTPRKAGAHMLVDERGETFGTVGGGAIEHEALRHARCLLESGGGSTAIKRHLTQELGMCCGGEMTVFVEVIEAAPRFFLFGAGHIARPLAALARGCGFRVTVVDERPEWASAERFPGVNLSCQAPEDFVRALESTHRDYVVVATHDHRLDQRLVEALLRGPLKFLGMIGSIPKQRKFALRLRARGFGDEEIARLHSPLGLPIAASTPEEIAISVMAELVAIRRGAAVAAGWVPPARHERRHDAEAAEFQGGPSRNEPSLDAEAAEFRNVLARNEPSHDAEATELRSAPAPRAGSDAVETDHQRESPRSVEDTENQPLPRGVKPR